MKHLWLILPVLLVFSCEDKKDTTPPETTITSPASGSTVNEVVNVTCMSTDNKEVSKVELWVDGVNTGLTDEMVYVNYDTIPITGFGGHIVPTINPACYSNSKGEFSQMSGFVRNMVGDTAEISITYGLREVSEETNQINFSVVLD